MPEFKGAARPMTDDDIRDAAERIGCDVAAFRAVLEVEGKQKGFDKKGRPLILFEPHKFYRELSIKKGKELLPTPERGAAVDAGLAYPNWGEKPYPKTSDGNYERLAAAIEIGEEPAFKSVSMGVGQVLGSHYKKLGFDTAASMFDAARESEQNQLALLTGYVRTKHLEAALRGHDWKTFAVGYNGPKEDKPRFDKKGNKEKSYHELLADAYAKWRRRLEFPRETSTAAAASPSPAPRVDPRFQKSPAYKTLMPGADPIVPGDRSFVPRDSNTRGARSPRGVAPFGGDALWPIGPLDASALRHRMQSGADPARPASATADPTIRPFASEILDRVRRSSQSIDEVSKATGVDSLAIAGSMAREMNKFKYDYTQGREGWKRWAFNLVTPNNEKKTDAELWADYKYIITHDISRDTPYTGPWHRFRNPLLRDVGPGRMEELNAMNALIWYMWKHPDAKDDPLGLKARYAPEGKPSAARWSSLIKDYKGEPGKGDAADGFDLTAKLAGLLLDRDKASIISAIGGQPIWDSLSKTQQSELLISDYTIGPAKLRELIAKNRKTHGGVFSAGKLDEFTGADYLMTGANLPMLQNALAGRRWGAVRPEEFTRALQRLQDLRQTFPGGAPTLPDHSFVEPRGPGSSAPVDLIEELRRRGRIQYAPPPRRTSGDASQAIDAGDNELRDSESANAFKSAFLSKLRSAKGDAITLRQEGREILPSMVPRGLTPEEALQLSRSAPTTLEGYATRFPSSAPFGANGADRPNPPQSFNGDLPSLLAFPSFAPPENNPADATNQPVEQPNKDFESWRPPQKRSEGPGVDGKESNALAAFARLDPADMKAARAKAVEGRDVTVAPVVEQSSLQSALETLQAINAEIAKANGGIVALNFGPLPALSASAQSFDVPSMGRRLRGDFSSAGDPVN
jgi:hypothetical protein